MESAFALNVLQNWITLLRLQTNFFSLVLHGVADSESRSIFIDVVAYGKQSDGGTFCGSIVYHFLEDFESTFAKPAIFEGSGTEMPFVIRGDETYPLKTYLMKLLARKYLSCVERVFNCRLSLATRCVECAFVILITKWRLLNKAIETNFSKAEKTVRFVCLLRDIILDLEGTTHDPSVPRNFRNTWILSGQNKCQR